MSFITLFLCLSLFRSYFPIFSSPDLRVQWSFLSYVCPSLNTFLILEHPWLFSTFWMKVIKVSLNHFIWQGWKGWVVSFQTVHVYRTTIYGPQLGPPIGWGISHNWVYYYQQKFKMALTPRLRLLFLAYVTIWQFKYFVKLLNMSVDSVVNHHSSVVLGIGHVIRRFRVQIRQRLLSKVSKIIF